MQQPMRVDGDVLIREFFHSFFNLVITKCFTTLYPKKEDGVIELEKIFKQTQENFSPVFNQIAAGDITGGIELKKIIQASFDLYIRDTYDAPKIREEESSAIESVIEDSLEEKPKSKIMSIN